MRVIPRCPPEVSLKPVNARDSWLVWQRGTDAWPPGAVVTGAGVAGVLAGAGVGAVVLVDGEPVAPGPGAAVWLAHPAVSTARHAAAASAAAARVAVMCAS
jgi:hypothetical protein